MKGLGKYIGRVIRLRPAAFIDTMKRIGRTGQDLENRFLVAAINLKRKRLVCYGAQMRLLVAPCEVVLV